MALFLHLGLARKREGSTAGLRLPGAAQVHRLRLEHQMIATTTAARDAVPTELSPPQTQPKVLIEHTVQLSVSELPFSRIARSYAPNRASR